MSYNNGGGMVGGSRTRYLPFGAYRTAPTQTYTDLGYTSQKHNDDLGLIYYNARYYVPGIARFASADTIVPDASNPQSFNRYVYGLNNPLRYTDPTGHLSEDEIKDYFGYEADENMTLRDRMIEAGWQDFLVDWLLNPDTHFGDVFTYENSSGGFGEAMLALFETQSVGSGVYEGGFYGVGRSRVGQRVHRSSVHSLNDDTPQAVSLEQAFAENFDALPRKTGSDSRNYYDPVMYTDLNSAKWSYLGTGFAVTGAVATGAVIVAACASNPAGWIACGGAALTTGWGGISATATFLGTATTLITPPDPTQYPLLQIPVIYGNAPISWGWGQPSGYYDR
ncbi:MAG: RHS repeat-associated core domain-containing protein [Ardenticatenales bacterium]|nr:RHS repeat-associated core domain-containing protein [Ardenticatenales bacterium]